MLFSPHTGREVYLLIDGALEVLERERIDESVVRHRGVRFRAGLED